MVPECAKKVHVSRRVSVANFTRWDARVHKIQLQEGKVYAACGGTYERSPDGDLKKIKYDRHVQSMVEMYIEAMLRFVLLFFDG